jgi:uncharacterized protein YoaH (UPF0181 family)
MAKTKAVENIDELMSLLGAKIAELADGEIQCDLATEISNMAGKMIGGIAIQLKALELQAQYNITIDHVGFLQNVKARPLKPAQAVPSNQSSNRFAKAS